MGLIIRDLLFLLEKFRLLFDCCCLVSWLSTPFLRVLRPLLSILLLSKRFEVDNEKQLFFFNLYFQKIIIMLSNSLVHQKYSNMIKLKKSLTLSCLTFFMFLKKNRPKTF